MNKIVFVFFSVLFFNTVAMAQPTGDQQRQELEKERQQLKQELEEKERLLGDNKKVTKQSMAALAIVNSKINLQEKVVNNISRDINVLDNNINKSQRDVRKLSLLLDTLKQEYAKSMIYSYKNRSNADFLNFIFSSSSFNDAIKRINYLKSYRSYREMQGENILRTQGLLKIGIKQLGDTKHQKDEVLETQSKEIDELAKQQKEKDQIVKKLKEEGKQLNQQIAARKKQMQKVNSAIAAAIKRALEDARKQAAIEAEKKRKADLAAKAAANSGNNKPSTAPSTKPARPVAAPPKGENALLPTEADVTLNKNFKINKGKLPWPIEKGYIIMGFGPNTIPGTKLVEDNPGLTIGSDIGASVKAIFDGEVSTIRTIEDMQIVIIKHGEYFSTYSNLSSVNVSQGQSVHTGQLIGRVAANDDGVGAMDLFISNERGNVNPELWLRHK